MTGPTERGKVVVVSDTVAVDRERLDHVATLLLGDAEDARSLVALALRKTARRVDRATNDRAGYEIVRDWVMRRAPRAGRRDLGSAFDRLSYNKRAALVLRCAEDLDSAAISRVMRSRPAVVNQLIATALVDLASAPGEHPRTLAELTARFAEIAAPDADEEVDESAPDADEQQDPHTRIGTAAEEERAAAPSGAARDALGPEWERALACVLLAMMGFGLVFHFGLSYGDVLAVLLCPLWIRSFGRYRHGVLFGVAGAVTVIWGVVLARISAANHALDAAGSRDTTVELVHLLMTVGVLLWARTLLSNGRVAVFFGAGLLAYSAITPSDWGTNPWKFAFAIPVAIVILGLVNSARRPAPPMIALLLLAVVSTVLDSRAYSAALALCVLVLLWRSMRSRAVATSKLGVAVLMLALAATVYVLATQLLVDGYLGRSAQARSIEQIRTSGSLVLGGRPELAASVALIEHHPLGYGVGVVPSAADVQVAKVGLAQIDYDPNNKYVDSYMFGGHFELHSIFGDVWANWGLVGLAFVAGVGVLAVRTVIESVAARTHDAVTIYACVWTLWNIGFSPLIVSAPVLALAVGLSLRVRRR